MRQILVNLVGNAIKFTEYGEILVEVQVAADHATRVNGDAERVTLLFTVRDTGIGIPLDRQQQILEPFVQADGSMTRKYGGTGLGLAISKQLAELMAGHLQLESEVGHGSTFSFTACLDVVHDYSATPPPESVLDVRGLSVLVVDDNATNRRILQQTLSAWQMCASVVAGGHEALHLLTEARATGMPYALVLLDAQMPEMDGFSVAAEIQQEPSLAGTTILMLSSADLAGDAARCRELGIALHLTKPIAQAELWEAIMVALNRPKPVALSEPLAATLPAALQLRPLRILLAEDNPVNQRVAHRMLEKHGHTVVVVGDGQAALETLARASFDLVLMDVQMPVLDGLETTAAIRAQEKALGTHLPIIAMTAHAMKGDREHCLAAGMDGYVVKPIKIDALHAAITLVFSDTPTTPEVLAAAP